MTQSKRSTHIQQNDHVNNYKPDNMVHKLLAKSVPIT